MSDLLCKECKHSFRELSELPQWGNGFEYRCKKAFVPEKMEHDPVIGQRKVRQYYERCNLVRLHEHSYKNTCGKEGIWWEPKNKRGLFKLIAKENYGT